MQRLLGLHALGRVGGLAASASSPLRLEVVDEPLERVLAAVEDEVVGELALLVGDLAVGRDVVRVDHREVEPGLDAVVQEDRVEDRARAGGETPKETLETPSEVFTPGSSALIAADALDRLDRGRASTPRRRW